MVTFSIITAFYYGNQYLPNLIKIAENNKKRLHEAFPDSAVELIIVNDSPEISVELPSYDSSVSVKVVNHIRNSGIHQTRITGLNNSGGDFIVFLDQDDDLADDCLLEEYKTIGKSDVVVANAYIECQDGTKALHFKSIGQFKNAFEIEPYIKGHNQIISPGQCLIRKSSIPIEWTRFVISKNGSDDLFLWMLLILSKKKFEKYERPLYTHKFTGNNLSAEETKMAKSSIEIAAYMRKISYFPKKFISAFVRNRKIKIALNEASTWTRLAVIIKNIDIIAPKLIWKARGKIGKFDF